MDPSSPPPGSMGGMESLPERQPSTEEEDPWWRGERPGTQDQEIQTESAIQVSSEKLEKLDLSLDDDLSSLINQHETEVRALHNKLLVSETENKKLQSESQTIKKNNDLIIEKLNLQIIDYNKIQEKLKYYEEECEKLKIEHNISEDDNKKDTEIHELRMQLTESKSENNKIKTQISELSVQCSQLMSQVTELTSLKNSLEQTQEEHHKFKTDSTDTHELRAQLTEAQAKCEAFELQIKTDEGRMQQAKWEMSSLQTCVDNLLKENAELRNDLTQMSQTFNDSREKFTTNEMYAEKLTEQVTALKDVVSIGKQMLGMRDVEVEQLQRKVQNLEDMLETEREKNSVLSEAFTPDTDIKKEYQAQLANFQSLKEIYAQRTELMGLENDALKDTLKGKNSQIELMEKRFNDIKLEYDTLKETLAGKETVTTELQHRVSDLNEECRSLTTQLSLINNLFSELGKSDVDLERLRSLQDALAEGLTDGSDNNVSNLSRVWCAFSELLENTAGEVPQPVEGSEGCYKSVNTPYGPQVVISVSQTFVRLKDLILEKKSLQKELGQLKNLNTHLETKLQQQESRLSLVLQELKKTWGVVNKMRSQHSQLRTSEAILRYDLQQKRKIVTELKQEMEYCRATWQMAKNKTSESERQYRNLRDEFASRRRRPLLADDSTEINSAESGYSDGRGEDDSGGSSTSDCEDVTGDMTGSEQSKSPDILPLDESRPGSGAFTDSTVSNETALEVSSSPNDTQDSEPLATGTSMSPNTGAIKKVFSAVVSETENTTEAEVVTSESTDPPPPQDPPKVDVEEILDARAARLKRLEEQCSQLFKRVVRTSNMSVAISNRLEELHEQYGENQENSARRRLRNSESEAAAANKEIPTPPPMPLVLPNVRLPTEIDQVEDETNNSDLTFFDVPEPEVNEETPQNKNLDVRIADPLSQNYLRRPAERFRRRSPTEEPQRVSTHRSHSKEVTESRDLVNAKLDEEKDRSEKIDRELTSLRVELANQGQQLKELSDQLASESTSKQEVEASLEIKQAECDAFILQLQQLTEKEAELRQRLEQTEEQSGSRLSELQELQGDTKHLHAAIIKLTKQKDALFKECYALKQAKREATWQADHQVAACSACGVSFSLLVRKHHCRLCGHIFCGACSSHWVTQHGENRRSRSCSECHSKNQIVTGATELGSESSLTSSLTDDPELVGAEGGDDEDEEEDFSVISEEELVLSQCVPYSPNPEILQYWKSCEIQSGLTRHMSELLTAGQKVTESVWVRAGSIYGVPLLITAEDCSPQVNVTWEFKTEPKCIAFSVLYKADADIPTESSSILVPTTRVNSHIHPIKGQLRARKAGLYTLMFDNSYSRFTGKKVNFSLICEVGSNSGRSSAGSESPLRTVIKSSSQDLDLPDQDAS